MQSSHGQECGPNEDHLCWKRHKGKFLITRNIYILYVTFGHLVKIVHSLIINHSEKKLL